jgi:hypothetical protein
MANLSHRLVQRSLPPRKVRSEEKLFSRAVKFADVVLVAAGIISLLLLLYVFYIYTWTGDRRFTNSSAGIFYYVVPAGLAMLFFAGLGFKRGSKINFAILCVSVFASVYVGEFFLRIANSAVSGTGKPIMVNLRGSQDKEKRAAKLRKDFNVSIDIRSGREVVDDLRQQGVDAVPIMSPRTITVHGKKVIPLGAISDKVTVLCNENGSWVIYEADERGFNNPKGIWHSGHIEIAAVGDSFTQGYCVPPDKNFVSLIRGLHPATLNLGMAGNGPLLNLAVLSEFLPLFTPRMVFWFYFENDLIDLQAESKDNLLMRYLKVGFDQGLVAQQREIDQALITDIEREKAVESARRARKETNSFDIGEFLKFTKLSAVRTTLGIVTGRSREELDAASRGPILELFRDILSQAKNRVSAWGGTLYFVYLPGNDRYIEPAREQRPRVLDVVKALGIPVIDIVPVFQAQGDPLAVFPFRGPGHYNEKGHRLVAEEVLKTLPIPANQTARAVLLNRGSE